MISKAIDSSTHAGYSLIWDDLGAHWTALAVSWVVLAGIGGYRRIWMDLEDHGGSGARWAGR